MRFLRRFLSDSTVQRRYIAAGIVFGDAVSYSMFGESGNMESLLKYWGRWEEEYAKRGFRTVSLDRFVQYGGYGVPIDDVIGRRREEGEKPVLHSEIYRKRYLGKIKPALGIEKIMEESQRGDYILPSTERHQ